MAMNPILVEHGGLRLPPGFRFHPTDEELVVQYLKRKAFSFPLPAAVISEIDLGNHDPWDLPGVLGGERYFFSLRETKRCSRATSSGYWKATGKEKQIMNSNGQLVGMKKVFVFFHRGKKPQIGSRTDWIMHEYRLADGVRRWNYKIQIKDWVACRVFNKKRGAKGETEGVPEIDSTSSSCVTDLSDESSDGEGGNSSAIS